MNLPKDFKEFIELLNSHQVRYVMIGGWVYNLYAPPRMTGDIDFYIEMSADNEFRLKSVLEKFGFGASLPPDSQPWLHEKKVIMLGKEPFRIDLICNIDGVSFEAAYADRMEVLHEGLLLPVISLQNLLKNKLAAGRDKDIADAAVLQRLLVKSGKKKDK